MLSRLARKFGRTNKTATQSAQPKQSMMVEPLEKRQMLAVSPVFAGTKIKGVNLSENGVSTNSTLITIPFTGDVVLVDQSKLRLFAYAINPLSNNLGQIKKTVNVVSAQVIAVDANNDGVDEHNYLQITTDRLMRKGGTIILNEGALQDTNGDVLATQTLKTIKGQNRERFTLACRMFIPTNFNRFTNDFFASSPTPATANNTISEGTATTNLDALLAKKVTAGILTQAQKDAAMTRFAATATKGTIPDHNLRAALFSLTGTFAEAAIGSFLDGTNVTGKPYTIIDFAAPDDSSVPVAQTSVRQSDGRLRTIFKPEFKGEPLQALSAWLAHEALHQDTSIGLQEEKVSSVIEILIYAQQANTDPNFLKAGSKLVNYENEKLAAFLNSGRAIFPYVGLLDPPNTLSDAAGVLPGSKADSDGNGVYTSFDNFIGRQYIKRGAVSQQTTGNNLLKTYYTGITTKTAPTTLNFNDALIADIDSFQATVGTKAAIVLAQQLKLGLA